MDVVEQLLHELLVVRSHFLELLAEASELGRLRVWRVVACAAGLAPLPPGSQLISDFFEGAFPSAVKWTDFTLRIPEGDLPTRNLTQELLAVIAKSAKTAETDQWHGRVAL